MTRAHVYIVDVAVCT